MLKQLVGRFDNYMQVHPKLKWVLLAIAIKLIYFVWFTYAVHQVWPSNKIVKGVFVKSWEYGDYLNPIENLIDKGTYYSLDYEFNTKLYTHRMPGFLPAYALQYWLFGRDFAYMSLVVLHYLLDGIAVYLLSMCALMLFNRRAAFYLTFLVYGLSPFVTVYNNHGFSEPLCTFAIVATLYFFLKGLLEKKKKFYFISGFFFCWAVFLRPSVGMLGVLFPIALLFYDGFKISRIKYYLESGILFSLTLVVCLSAWTYRNYKITGKPILLADTYDVYLTKQAAALWGIVITWGGDIQPWNPNSEARWFKPKTDWRFDQRLSNGNPFKSFIFTKDYGIADLRIMRSYYWLSIDSNESASSRNTYADSTVNMIKRFEQSFKTEKPFYYYCVTKLILLRDFILIRQTYALPFDKFTLYQKMVRAMVLLFYYFVIIGATIGLFMAWIKSDFLIRWVSLLPLLYIATHVKLGFIENRYLAEVYPVIILFLTFSLTKVWAFYQQKIQSDKQ